MRSLTTPELCAITEMPEPTLKRYRAAGIFEPWKPGHPGRGHSDLWSPAQVLAVSISRWLRRRGLGLREAAALFKCLSSMSTAELRGLITEGKTILLLGGLKNRPQFVWPHQVGRHLEAGLLLGVDLGKAWELLEQKIGELDALADQQLSKAMAKGHD